MKRMTALAFALALSAGASAQTGSPPLPNYAKTLSELAAAAPTGGAGGSGNAKVKVVTILGDASRPDPYAQLLEVGPNARIPAHHMPAIGSAGAWREPGTSATARRFPRRR